MLGTDIYTAMQTGKPYKVYTKTLVSKVLIVVLDPFDKPEEKILEGKPKTDEGAVKIWDMKGDEFFKTQNEVHLRNGTLVEWADYKQKVQEKTVEQSTDEELIVILSKPFLIMHKVLQGTNSITFLQRIKLLAIAEDKSERYIDNIDKRIAELESRPEE